MKFSLFALLFFLFGCSTLPQASDFDSAEIRQYQIIDSNGADSLVVGEYQSSQQRWRWLQTNALGVPLARQIYQNGQWQNDGFLPPNSQARALFIAIMLADHFANFPKVIEKKTNQRQQFISQGKLWLDISPSVDNRLFLKTPQGHWQMKRLNP